MGLGGDNQPVTRFVGMRVAESILGTPLPILVGQQRLSWKLLWYGAFNSQVAKQQGQGGSGAGKGGTDYVYSASVIGSVCMGPCANFLGVWDSTGRYAMDSESETATLPSSGPITYAPENQANFKQDTGVSVVTPYSVVANDYGSPGMVTLSGNQNVPLIYTTNPTPPAGYYTITGLPTTPVYVFNPAQAGASVVVNYVAYRYNIQEEENNIAAAVVTVQYESEYKADVGVVYYPGGQALTSVSGTPTLGAHYSTTGSVTSGTFSSGENVSQLTSGAAATLIGTVPTSGPMLFVGLSGTPDPTDIWVGATSGARFTPTAIPAFVGGQYNPNGGNYKFAPADFGLGVSISYTYTDPNTDTNAPNTLNLIFFGGALGQAPWSYLTSTFPSQALGYSECAYVASLGLYLGYSQVLPQLNFEIAGPYAFGNGIVDANPADAIAGLLTNPSYKYNFPGANIHKSLLGSNSIPGSVTSGTFVPGELVIQTSTLAEATLISAIPAPMIIGLLYGPEAPNATSTWVGQTSGAVYTPTAVPIFQGQSSARAMWTANNFFISDILDSQTSVMDTVARWCEAGQVYISWDEGMLKFTPLCDTTTVGNGVTYSPPTQPIIDLDDNDFVTEKGKDPISLSQTPWQNRWNRVNIRWSVRTNDYNEDILQVQDEASAQQYGLISESAQDCQFLCISEAAQFAANMRLQRMSAIYTTYNFTLKSNFAFLSPGDIITITDGLLGTQGTMFGRTPVRITKMTDDPIKGITIEAENFPWSVGSALLGNPQAQLPSNTNDGPQEDPGNTLPLLFSLPNQAAQWQGGQIYIFGNGSNVNWGGFETYVSFDGINYSYYGRFSSPARLGVTAASSTSAVFTLTQVSVAGGVATYHYSSYTGTIAVDGATLQVAGFSNAGNDGPFQITGISGGSSGTFTVDATTQVNETHAATATGGFPTVSGGQDFLDNSNVLQVNMQQSGAVLQSVDATARDAYVTLSAIVSPGQTFVETDIAGTGVNLGQASGAAGPNTAGTGISFNWITVYTNPWSNPSYVSSSSSYATCALPGLPDAAMELLEASDFGFALPAGSVIAGIVVTFTIKSTNPDSSDWLNINVGSTVVGEFASQTKQFSGPFPSTPTTLSFGSATDTWGMVNENLAYTRFNQTQWLVDIFGGSFVAKTVSINNVQVTLYLSGATAIPWTNPTNVNSTSAYASVPLTTAVSQGVACTGYNFNLPFGFELDGIEVTVNGYVSPNGAATLTAMLTNGELQVGAQRTVGITSTAADVTLGSNTDDWDAEQFEDLDTLNSSEFGVVLFASGAAGQTANIRNVRITLYGTSTTNLELISYELATLDGLNTYALSSIRRGIMGSYPCDHPIGSSFARLDQATLIYQVPSNYIGNSLFFKFPSFNAYGNQLQPLSEVVAYEVPIGTLSPGAIDITTGALLTGTPNFSVSQYEAVAAAAHGLTGIDNIQPGAFWGVPSGPKPATPQWIPLNTSGGGGGGGTIQNLYVVEVEADYDAVAWDFVEANTTSTDIAVTLPPISANANVEIGIKKTGPGSSSGGTGPGGLGQFIEAGRNLGQTGFTSTGAPSITYMRYSLPATLTLSGVTVSGGIATYAYSSYFGPLPTVYDMVMVTGFNIGGNNGLFQIATISGGASGTFTLAATTQANEAPAAFTLTQVSVTGSIATYSYSSYGGTLPASGADVFISGFTNAGNNTTINLFKIVTISGGASGTFTVNLTTQVNETHAASASVQFAAFASGGWLVVNVSSTANTPVTQPGPGPGGPQSGPTIELTGLTNNPLWNGYQNWVNMIGVNAQGPFITFQPYIAGPGVTNGAETGSVLLGVLGEIVNAIFPPGNLDILAFELATQVYVSGTGTSFDGGPFTPFGGVSILNNGNASCEWLQSGAYPVTCGPGYLGTTSSGGAPNGSPGNPGNLVNIETSGSDTCEISQVTNQGDSYVLIADLESKNWFVVSGYSSLTQSTTPNLPPGQVGDILRCLGGTAYAPVNYAQSSFGIFPLNQTGSFAVTGILVSIAGGTNISVLGSLANVAPTATSQYAVSMSSSSVSLNTVIGFAVGSNGNVSLFGILAFYRWSCKLALGVAAVTGSAAVRYWMGLACYNSSGIGNNHAAITGTTAYAQDTPNKTTIGFRFSSGTDLTWKAVVITAGSSVGAQTTVDTGIVPDTNPHLFEMTTNATGTAIYFLIDGYVVATITTNLPTPSSGGDAWGEPFLVGDNKDTGTTISLTFYSMQMSLK
jgi:hypothetical protein